MTRGLGPTGAVVVVIVVAAVVLLGVAACGTVVEVGGPAQGVTVDDDPLALEDAPEAGSFDDLHERILARRCAGAPGLCHAGQFEPNLATPASAYASLVERPALEIIVNGLGRTLPVRHRLDD